MKRNRREQTLYEIIEPIVTGLGFSLWGIHAPTAGKHTLVSVFINSEEGVNLDQCAQVSRDIGLALEVEDVMPGAYRLEVSSPGLERRFFTTRQLKDYLGRTIKVELDQMQDGRRKFAGVLREVAGDAFVIEDEGEASHRIEWDRVKKARLVHEF